MRVVDLGKQQRVSPDFKWASRAIYHEKSKLLAVMSQRKRVVPKGSGLPGGTVARNSIQSTHTRTSNLF